MRAGRLLMGVFVAAMIAIGAFWATYTHNYVLHERATAEWSALTLMDQTLAKGHSPVTADAAVFLSNAALDQALKQLDGATIKPPAAKTGDLTVTVDDVHVVPGVGMTGVVIDVDVASPQRHLAAKMSIEGTLAFRRIATRDVAGDRPVTTAEFAVSVLKAEPHFTWGFLDLPGRHFVSDAIASGLMLALDNHLTVSIPFDDTLAFNTGFDNQSVVPTSAGTVTLKTTLPGQRLEQRFNVRTPLVIGSGIWLLADASTGGQEPIAAPAVPSVSLAELQARDNALRAKVARETMEFNQAHDLVLSVKGDSLVRLVDQMRTLAQDNLTVTIQSTATTGQLASNGKSYAELSNPAAATAHVAFGAPSARWESEKGVAVSMPVSMALNASVHAHVNPGIGGGIGTTLGMVGNADKTVAGTVSLNATHVGTHSALLLGFDLPCDSLTAELRTDGKLIAGPLHTDMPSVGMRWSMALPSSLGQPTVVIDDLPRRFALPHPATASDGVSVATAHPAVEFAVRNISAATTQDGYLMTSDLAMRPADSLALSPDIEAQRAAIRDGINAARAAAVASCHPEQHMSVLIGDLEIGPNGEIWKRFANIVHDLTQGPGPSNDLVGQDGFVAKTAKNAVKDITQGPGPTNDVVGRQGWLRSRLGF
jgi:hypothetical protein